MEFLTPEEWSTVPAATAERLSSHLEMLKQELEQKGLIEDELVQARQSRNELIQRLSSSVSSELNLRRKLDISYEERQGLAQKLLQLEEVHFKVTSQQVEMDQQLKGLLKVKEESTERVHHLSEEVLKLREALKKQEEWANETVRQKRALELRVANANSVRLELSEIEERFEKQERAFNEKKLWYIDQLDAKEKSMETLKRKCEETVANELNAKEMMQHELDEMKRQRDEAVETKDRLKALVSSMTDRLRIVELEHQSAEEQWQEKFENLRVITEKNEEALRNRTEAFTELEASLREVGSSVAHFTQAVEEKDKQLEELRAHSEAQLNEKESRIVELENEIKQLKHEAEARTSEGDVLEMPLSDYQLNISPEMSLKELRESYFDLARELKRVEAERDTIQQNCAHFVKEIEERLPHVQALKEDKEDLTSAVECLQKKVECAKAERSALNARNKCLSNELATVREERDRLNRSCSDLSRQVKTLLVTVEHLRDPSVVVADLSRIDGEETDVVLFRNVEEMQLRNQQLLSKLRQASIERDQLVKEATEKECHEIKVQLETVSQRLENRIEICSQTKSLVQITLNQRDTYRRLYDGLLNQYEELKKRYSSKRRRNHDADPCATVVPRMIDVTNMINRHNAEVDQLQDANLKLEAELAQSQGRIRLQEDKIGHLEFTNGILETRLRAMEKDRGSLTASVNGLKEELEAVRKNLLEQRCTAAELKTRNEKLKRQLESSERSISQLERELEFIRALSYQIDKLTEMVEEFKVCTEIEELCKALKPAGDWQALTKERDSLLASASLLREENEKLKADRMSELDDLKVKLEERSRAVEHLTRQLNWQLELTGTLEETVQRKDEECRALRSAISQPEEGDSDRTDLLLRLNIAEARYKECLDDLSSTKAALNNTVAELERSKGLADSLESSLKELQETQRRERMDGGAEIKRLESIVESSAARIEELSETAAQSRRLAEDEVAKYKAVAEQEQRELLRLRAELDDRNERLDAESGELATLKRTIVSLRRELTTLGCLLEEKGWEIELLKKDLAAKSEAASPMLDEGSAWDCKMRVIKLENKLAHTVKELRNIAADSSIFGSEAELAGPLSTAPREPKVEAEEHSVVGSSGAASQVSWKKLVDKVLLDFGHCQDELSELRSQFELVEKRRRAIEGEKSSTDEGPLPSPHDVAFKISEEDFILIHLDRDVQHVVGGLDMMELKRRLYESSVTIDKLQAVIARSAQTRASSAMDVEEKIDELIKEKESLELSIEELTSRLESLASMYSVREAKLRALREETDAIAAARSSDNKESSSLASTSAKETVDISAEISGSQLSKSTFENVAAQYKDSHPVSVSSTDQFSSNQGYVTSSVISSRSPASRESPSPTLPKSPVSKVEWDSGREPTSSTFTAESVTDGSEAASKTRRRSASPSSSDNVKRFRAESPVQVSTTEDGEPIVLEQDTGYGRHSPDVGSSLACGYSAASSHSPVCEPESSDQSAIAGKEEEEMTTSNDELRSCQTNDILVVRAEKPSTGETSRGEAQTPADSLTLTEGGLSSKQNEDTSASVGRSREPIVWDLGDNGSLGEPTNSQRPPLPTVQRRPAARRSLRRSSIGRFRRPG